jgi:toxin-antitoxin system PIN domain toxin
MLSAGTSRTTPATRELTAGDQAFGVPDLVLSGFLRIVTHPRIFVAPSAIEEALAFAERLRESAAYVPVSRGPRHWAIFAELWQIAAVRGNLVQHAYVAALAIESGNEWITTDRDYSRFPGLRWRLPAVP